MPRRVLLPPFLESSQAWVDLCNAIDKVFGTEVDLPATLIGKIRDLWILNPSTESKIANGQLFSESEVDFFDKETLVKQLNFLGVPLGQSDALSVSQYARFHRNVSQFWYSKGKADFKDFLSYCLNSRIDVRTLWTENYFDFYEADNPIVGTPVYQGGTWYPTTHVNVGYDASAFSNIDLDGFVQFFYDVSNYPLVLNGIVEEEFWIISDAVRTEPYVGVSVLHSEVVEEILANFDASAVPYSQVYTGDISDIYDPSFVPPPPTIFERSIPGGDLRVTPTGDQRVIP